MKQLNRNATISLIAFLSLLGAGAAYSQAAATQAISAHQTGTIQGTVESRSSRYRQNTVVYIDQLAGDFLPPQNHPVVDQKSLTFHPHVSVITRGTTVDFHNSDKVKHSIFSPSKVADNLNLGTYTSAEVRSWTFNKYGDAVLLCNIHTEMEAWVVILQNPYFAVSDRRGNFEITDVPPGSYTLKVWNKKYAAESQEIVVKEGEATQVSMKLKGKKRR